MKLRELLKKLQQTFENLNLSPLGSGLAFITEKHKKAWYIVCRVRDIQTGAALPDSENNFDCVKLKTTVKKLRPCLDSTSTGSLVEKPRGVGYWEQLWGNNFTQSISSRRLHHSASFHLQPFVGVIGCQLASPGQVGPLYLIFFSLLFVKKNHRFAWGANQWPLIISLLFCSSQQPGCLRPMKYFLSRHSARQGLLASPHALVPELQRY